MDPEIPVKPGELLAGKYHVDRVMEPGGMGVVVVATHLELRESVCLKFMLRSIATPENVERFVREARVAARLRGPHVCRVMDLARLPDGVPFIVMELLVGTDMAALARRRKRLRPAEAAELVRQACEGLAEAHDLGIVHRDIKPANLFVTRRRDGAPHVKVLDFGCSKASFGDGGVATGTQAVFGTPAYMSPEQMRSTKRVDARTDIWALGAVLYELLSGRQAFQGDSYASLLSAVERGAPADLFDAPDELAAIVDRCLRRDRSRRYASADDLGAALGAYLAALPSPRTVVGRAPAPTPTPQPRPPEVSLRPLPVSAAKKTAREPKRGGAAGKPHTPRHMAKALDAAVAAMSGRQGATLHEIQQALAAANLPYTDAKALLQWAGKHRGVQFDVDFDGRVRAHPKKRP